MNCVPEESTRQRVKWKQPVEVAAPAAQPEASEDAYALIVAILERFPEARLAVVRAFREKLGYPEPGAL